MSSSTEGSEIIDEKKSPSKSKRKIDIPIQTMIKDELQEEDDREPENRLTGYVREHYLNHLIKLLNQNFEMCSKEKGNTQVIDREEIEQCAIELEQQALRGSILVKLYQKAIAQMAANIKRNTKQLQLHDKLVNFLPLRKEQESQTDTDVTVVMEEQGSPALPDTTQLPTDSPCPLPLDVEDRMSRSTYYELESDHLWPQEYWLTQETEDSTIPTIVNYEPTVLSKSQPTSPTDSITKLLENNSCSNSEGNGEILDSLDNVEEMEVDESKLLIELQSDDNDMLSLDQRVAMIHGEFEIPDDIEAKSNPRKVLVWRLEKLHYVKLLDSRLKLMSKAKRWKLEKLFKKLFYIKHVRPEITVAKTPLLETLDNQLNKQKDKMAPWIIKHLMPYYNNGKIANKELFKSTAKYVSEALLDKSHESEERDIQKCVDRLMSTM